MRQTNRMRSINWSLRGEFNQPLEKFLAKEITQESPTGPGGEMNQNIGQNTPELDQIEVGSQYKSKSTKMVQDALLNQLPFCWFFKETNQQSF